MLKEILLGLTLGATPGPVNIAAIKRGLAHQPREAILLSVGAIGAEVIRVAIVYFGVYPFLVYPAIQTLLWFGGCGFMLYLGVTTIGATVHLKPIDTGDIKRSHLIAEGFLLSITNPLAIVFWVGIYGSFLAENVTVSDKLSGLATAAYIIAGLLLWVLIINGILLFSKKIISPKMLTIISFVCGVMLLIFGLHFGYRAIHNFFT